MLYTYLQAIERTTRRVNNWAAWAIAIGVPFLLTFADLIIVPGESFLSRPIWLALLCFILCPPIAS